MRYAVMVLGVLLAEFALGQKRDTLPRLCEHYLKQLATFQKEKTRTVSYLFVGDAVVERAGWSAALKDSSFVNRGIAGDNTYGLAARLDEALRFSPRVVLVHIGNEDLLAGLPEDEVLENIFGLVMRIRKTQPRAVILISALLPWEKDDDAITEKRMLVNDQLSKISQRFRYTFIPVPDLMLQGGRLKVEYQNTDGSLSGAGFNSWFRVLREGKYL